MSRAVNMGTLYGVIERLRKPGKTIPQDCSPYRLLRTFSNFITTAKCSLLV